jgi:citrate lyase beta subunit
MILISAKNQKGFWRCGMFHPPEQIEHADNAFTPEQLDILQAEPMLSVVIVPDKPEEPKPKTEK